MRTPSRILVATDFGPTAEPALLYGCELAKRFGAILTIVHVVDDLSAHLMLSATFPETLSTLPNLQHDLETAAHAELDRRTPHETGLVVEGIILTSAHPATALLACADEIQASLIVTGTHGRARLDHLVAGSVAEQLVRSAHCPVLVTRPATTPGPEGPHDNEERRNV